MKSQSKNKLNKILQSLSIALFSHIFVQRIAQALSSFASFVVTKLRLRSRYLFTRQNNLRLRYVTVLAVFATTVLAAVTLVSQNSNALGRLDVVSVVDPIVAYEHGLLDTELFGEVSLASVTMRNIPEPLPLNREVVIEPGDALGLVMEKQGVGSKEASSVIQAVKEHYDPRSLKAGQKIHMHFDEGRDNVQQFREMKIELNPIKTLVVARAGDEFRATVDEKEVKKVLRARQAQVQLSLYGSAAKAGIPQGIVAEAIRIFSWSVDFQRDIRPEDKFEIMYESYETKSGYVAKNGNILYAKLTLSGREIPLYRFEMDDGRSTYFQPDGRSIKRTLMRTPINGARVSSGFGHRRHPILGYNKMHKGIDFAAPSGTPIFAAGDGVIERANWNGGYGKYIRIRHNSKLKTAYAHLKSIKSNIKPGTRVTQGQVIGYLGSTGRSTGPHLHYEVISNGRQVNPRSVDLPIGEELEGKQKKEFDSLVKKRKQLFASVLEGTKVADSKPEKKSIFN